MTNRLSAPARALPLANRPGFRASLLGRASLAAMLAGTASAPRALAGGSHVSLQQALGSAAAAAARVTGNSASIAAGQQAAIGIANLQTAVRSMQQALARQSGAHGAASTSFNGLGAGGLAAVSACEVAAGACVQSAATANAMIQGPSNSGGTVTVTQTAPQAVIDWSSFNVGTNTHLVFNQTAGGAAASSWTVLNRITSNTSPSQIFGSISAPGQVLILNPNGVLFAGGAQVNLHSLVAGAISLSDAQFINTGIYGTYGTEASLTAKANPADSASSSVMVQPGAIITTPAPADASDGGGSVILLAATVDNGGTIETPAGQTILGAGRYFTLKTGYAVPANTTITPGSCAAGESVCSTTLGTEIDATTGGTATNTGYIAATTGDITLAGDTILQGGILYATTSVSRRGTIHLLADTTQTKIESVSGTPTAVTVANTDSAITLAPGSVTMIAPDPNSLTASNSQRNDTPRTAYNGQGLPDQAGLTDYPDRSRVEITTGGVVNFQTNSLVLANGGQVAISTEPNGGNATAQGRVFMAAGAQIDVSGLNNVIEPMSANIFSVSIQGGTVADSPTNRLAKSLFSTTLTFDARQVIYVAPSTVDEAPRDYTAGGLLEVSGELAEIEQSIDEWSAIGGNVTMRSGTVVSQPGAVVNIAGGTIVYQAGSIPQTYLIGPGGVLYNANTAPTSLTYSGFYDGDVIQHKRWHTTDTYENPLLTPASIQSPAYIEGRDAGTLTLATPTALFEGTINAGVQTGPYQTVAHNTVTSAGTYTDPVTINQNVAPQAGSLYFADSYYPGDSASIAFPTNVTIAALTPSIAGSLTATGKIDASQTDNAVFGAGQLDGLGGIFIETGAAKSSSNGSLTTNVGAIDVEGDVTLAPGGTVTLAAPSVTLDASISARSGSVTLETIDPILVAARFPGTNRGSITVSASGTIDTRGVWTNLLTDPADTSGAAFINGGNVSLLSTGALTLAAGSLIDASSGAIATSATSITGGKGGNIALVADDPALLDVKSPTDSKADRLAPAMIDGTVRSLGVTAGGTFSLTAPSIAIGNGVTPSSNLQVALSPGFFLSGFSAYVLNGFYTPTGALGAVGSAAGVVVEPGTAITVAEPVWQATPTALLSPSGTDPSVPLAPVLNPEFILNPATNSFARRAGASLTLNSTLSPNGGQTTVPGSGITIGAGASITVDTGQSVTLESPSQITVNGAIHAPSGTISILNTGLDAEVDPVTAARLSIWIGGTSVLDVAGEAVTGLNAFGEPVGEVFAGGSIVLGAGGNLTSLSALGASSAYGAAYIFVRPGAVLDASGASASLDLSAGTYGATSATLGQAAPASLTNVASAGGTIAFSSDFGIYLDNTAQGGMLAASGGAGAAGGEIVLRLGDPGYSSPGTSSAWASWAFTPHQIVVSQETSATPLPSDLTPGDGSFATAGANGQAAISQQQISNGGFGSIFLLALDQITFNGSVNLQASQSITLADYATSDTSKAASVTVSAPYVLLAGANSANYAAGLSGIAYASPDILYDNVNFGSNSGTSYSKVSPCVSGLSDCYNASLTVTADLIDLEAQVAESGAHAKFFLGKNSSGASVYGSTLDSYGFNTVDLVSGGDIRFVPNSYGSTNINDSNGILLEDDTLVSEGNIGLDAARIYPATGVDATIVAGFNYWSNQDTQQHNLVDSTLYYGGSITIAGSQAGTQQAPLSVFGRLGFEAATVTQDGNIYAPLGEIGLGYLTGSFEVPNPVSVGPATNVLSVTLGAGSTTSVSANGLAVPFGGTTDGTSYAYAGQALNLPAASLGGFLPTIAFNAPVTNVAAGAILDLAGGGTLTGGTGELVSGGTLTSQGVINGTLTSQGFISGRGGSTDTLVTPFIGFNAKTLSVTQPTLTQDPIFAIVPSFQSAYAPVSELDTPTTAGLSYYGSLPQVGEQITLAKSTDGLAAGTYTLLPSYYALLPGAYRVQIVASSVAGEAPALTGSALSLGNGTVETTGNLSAANTGVYNVTPSAIYLTPAAAVRTYSQYDEESYATFGVDNAAVFGTPRPFLPQDAGAIQVTLGQLEQIVKKKHHGTITTQTVTVNGTGSGFNFDGTALLSAGAGGYDGQLIVAPANSSNVEILSAGGTLAAQAVGISAAAIDAVKAPIVQIGGVLSGVLVYGGTGASLVTVDTGATLSAGALFLNGTNGITVDAGATLTTIGQTVSAPDSDTGSLFSAGSAAVLGLANGNFLFAPPTSSSGTAPITIGACAAASGCAGAATDLLSDGFLGFLANGPLNIGTNVVFGARDIQLDAGLLTIGTPSAASASGTSSGGVTLTQALLDQLIAGNGALGLPALQTLSVTAATAIAFGSGASLNTIDPATGTSTLGELDITTPEFLGDNASGGATITTGTLVWNSLASASATPSIPTGFGTGSGTLRIEAADIVLGYPAASQSQNNVTLDHLVGGFGTVDFDASQAFSANNKASLSVYQSVSTTSATSSSGSTVTTTTTSGGTLDINSPVVTTAAGAILGVTAGGDINLAGAGSSTATSSLGGEIDLTAGGAIAIDTRVALESGKFVANAADSISLGGSALLDLSGPTVKFFTQSRGSFGGTVELVSQTGSITEAAGALIDIAATDSNAGSLTLIAREGTVGLAGTLQAGAPGGEDAGSVAITASSFGGDAAFQSLTNMLSAGGATYAQNFEQVGGGNLSVGSMTAQNVGVSVDAGGSLTVTGVIDASGQTPGSIGLAGSGGLTLASGAVLNAQETQLHLDQLGELILAENRSHIELQVASNTGSASLGTVSIAPGVTIAMGGPGGLALGDLEIDAPRNADNTNVNVSASGSIAISGAATIALNAFKTYEAGSLTTLTNGATVTIAPGGTLTQADLTAIDTDSQAFMNAAVTVSGAGSILGGLTSVFATELAGLATYADQFHLRPGVEIDSDTNSSTAGNLTVAYTGKSCSANDTCGINLTDFRFNTVNPLVGEAENATGYGGGEPGVLWLRAQNNLNVDTNISDGFGNGTPTATTFTGSQDKTVTVYNLWSLWPMLAAGDLSWSIRLVAGADIDAADSRAALSPDIASAPAATGQGAMTLNDPGFLPTLPYQGSSIYYQSLNVDVIRTGTGYLDLYSGGNFAEKSPFGIYTSGTETTDPNAPVVAANSNGGGSGGEYFPEDGGDLNAAFGGTAQGFIYYAASVFVGSPLSIDNGYATSDLNSWLGVGKTDNGSAGWWVDFGQLLKVGKQYVPILYAPTGFGTFGGGNLSLRTGGNAGDISADGSGNIVNPKKKFEFFVSASGIDVTVGSTGYQAGGTETTLGGGDITMEIGGALNPVTPSGTLTFQGNSYSFTLNSSPLQEAFGELSNLRGSTALDASSVGQIDLTYSAVSTAVDPRPTNPYVSESIDNSATVGGPVLVLGDGQANIETRGDLVFAGVGDGGTHAGLVQSFWQPQTALDLFSAGGNLVPTTINEIGDDDEVSNQLTYFYPPLFYANAASGNVYLSGGYTVQGSIQLELAPSPYGTIGLLAAQSIYDISYGSVQQLRVAMSGAPTTTPSEIPGLLFPSSNSKDGYSDDTATGTLGNEGTRQSNFYAVNGDIVGLLVGSATGTQYIGAGPTQIIAGGDIISTGGVQYSISGTSPIGVPSPDFFLNTSPTDISLIQAGKDIIYANAEIAGPGELEIVAGGNIYQGDQGVLLSIGEIGKALTPTTRESGAGITVLAGLNGGYNPAGFANLYLNPADLASGSTPLQDQKGKVERTYLPQLVTWLQARGYAGTEQNALAYFLTLPEFEQTTFLLTVYTAELNQSGLDYNNPASRFYHSYVEGKEAIAALFPNTDPTGQSAPNGGSLTLFSGIGTVVGNGSNLYDLDSAIRTEFGGAIQTVVPYGQTLLGNYGIVPQATAGILTQGSGDIDMYSYGSVILGQSRVLTTYGGNVLIWMSSDGEINAGRGSKTTALTPPPNISYDPYGNIFLSPTVPSSGAGIGALAPIAGIPAGDVNLIAPAGTIDAGEAGVRAAGNINVAALTVVNAANLSSGGKTSGVPVAAGPSAAATAAASAAAGSSQSANQNTLQQRAPQQLPSVIEVEVLAGGVAAESDEEKRKKHPRA